MGFQPSAEVPYFKPSQEFFHAFAVAANEVEVLFSDETFQAFKKLEGMIGVTHSPGFVGPGGKQTVDDFIQVQKGALRALYNETLPRRGRIQQFLWEAICLPPNASKRAH
jgi:hypothetical protein